MAQTMLNISLMLCRFSHGVVLCCVVLCCVVLCCVGLGWVGLGWVGLGCVPLRCVALRCFAGRGGAGVHVYIYISLSLSLPLSVCMPLSIVILRGDSEGWLSEVDWDQSRAAMSEFCMFKHAACCLKLHRMPNSIPKSTEIAVGRLQ